MKKIYMTMVAMLCGVAAMAQVTANLTVPEQLEVAAGSECELVVGMTASGNLAALAFRIGFPEGVGIKYEMVDDEDDDGNPITVPEYEAVVNAARSQGHGAAVQTTTEEGFMQVAITSNPVKNFKGTEGDIVTLTLTVAETVPADDYVITIKNVAASTRAAVNVPMDDVTIPLKVTSGVGINSINADDVNAPIYNVAGQRVSKAQKGVYIQNGKKVAVK